MSINPYESPQVVNDRPPRKVVAAKRSRKAVRVSPVVSVLIIGLAGLVGASLFFAFLPGLRVLRDSTYAFQTIVVVGAAGSFAVLIAADYHIQRQPPAFFSAVIGMLAATLPGLAISFGLGLKAYDLGTQTLPGAEFVGVLSYASFFFVLSLGGWLAICLRRRAISN